MKDFLKFTFASVIGVILANVNFRNSGRRSVHYTRGYHSGWHSRLIGY